MTVYRLAVQPGDSIIFDAQPETGPLVSNEPLGGVEILTRREAEVALMTAQGLTRKQVAEKLCVSPCTVRGHLTNIYSKLGVRGYRELTAHALRAGWVIPHQKPAAPYQEPQALLSGEPLCYTEVLTPREKEVVMLLVQGLTRKQVAEELGISPRTIQNHTSSVYGKLNLTNYRELINYALVAGWVTVSKENGNHEKT